MDGQIFSFFVMVVAAAGKPAVGLAIILMVFRNRSTLQIDDFDTLKTNARCNSGLSHSSRWQAPPSTV